MKSVLAPVCPECSNDFTKKGVVLEQYAADIMGSYQFNLKTKMFEYEEEEIDNGRDFIWSCSECNKNISDVAEGWLKE